MIILIFTLAENGFTAYSFINFDKLCAGMRMMNNENFLKNCNVLSKNYLNVPKLLK